MVAFLCSGNFVPLRAQEIFFVTYKNVTYFCFESMTTSTVEGLKSASQAVYETYFDCTALGGGIGEITVYGIAPNPNPGGFLPVEPDPFGFYIPTTETGGGGVYDAGGYQDYFSQPQRISVSSMSEQKVLELILDWFQWFCLNQETINASVSMMANYDKYSAFGSFGSIVNGGGSINDIPVRWQIAASKNESLNDGLLPGWREFSGSAVFYYAQGGDASSRRISLSFKSETEMFKIIRLKVPCIIERSNNIY